MADSPKSQGPSLPASGGRLTRAAQAGDMYAAGIDKPAEPRSGPEGAGKLAMQAIAAARQEPPCTTCKVALRIAIFFDGTGNNLDADVPTQEHSNVARLYRAHIRDDVPRGIHSRYVPGLGTYFKDIGDPGDDEGMAFARHGDERLDWAMREIDNIIARYVPANITALRFSLFGFSRGAALARAFAVRLQKRVESAGGAWRWKGLGCPAEIYFLGIFDTVASVGLPASSNTPILSAMVAKQYKSIDQGLRMRRESASNGVGPIEDGKPQPGIAFGRHPGADPTPGPIDGHMGWGSDLRLPPMLLKCVHFTAAHEVRNSFPLDSTREGVRLPVGIAVDERVYPGVHSDAGGGYRPGEGGKSPMQEDLISLVPLNEMLAEAKKAGVPLLEPIADDFRMSERMLRRWHAYMSHPSLTGNRPTEAWLLAHMRLYYAWRFHVIRRNTASNSRPEAGDLAERDKVYRTEAEALDRQIKQAEQAPARLATKAEQEAARSELQAAERAQANLIMRPASANERQAIVNRVKAAQARSAGADKAFADADDERLRLQARRNTLPGTGLTDRLDAYDRNLMLDVQAIRERRKAFPAMPLRPHYLRLLEAYEAEFDRHQGLLDPYPDAIALFDNHVHDSLAGFAKDVTLPSDPRVVYVGFDEKSRFARNKEEAESETA